MYSGAVTHWVTALWDPSQISCQEAVSMVAVPLDRRMGVKDMKQLSTRRLDSIKHILLKEGELTFSCKLR